MSAKENGEGDFSLGDEDAGEVFMLTFGAIGALALLDIDPAGATQLSTAPLTIEQAQALLSGKVAAAPTDLLSAPPAVNDRAFLAAIAALSPTSGDTPVALSLPTPEAAALAAVAGGPIYTVTASTDDEAIGSSSPAVTGAAALSLRGDNLVVALAAGAKLTIGGDNDLVLTSGDNTIDVLSGSSVAIEGGGAHVSLGANDALSLTGVGYQVRASGPDDIVTLRAASQATVYGDDLSAKVAAPNADLTMVGAGNTVNVASAGSTLTLGGDSSLFMGAAGDVNLMDASTLAAHGSGAAYLGANDYVSLFGAFDVYTASSSGLTVITAFSASDTLHLGSAYADIASLLGGSTETNGATTLHLSAANELTLVGLDKAAVASLATSGHIQLN